MATDAFPAISSAYERGRLRWALTTASPALALCALSCALSSRISTTLCLAGLVFTLVTGLLYVGQAPARGAYAGLLAGAVPLGLAHAAQLYGHVCTDSGCYSLCVPACTVGGVVAGVVVARAAVRSPSPAVTLAGAAAVATLTGSLGCSCVGYGGVLGLVAGIGASVGVSRLVLRPA